MTSPSKASARMTPTDAPEPTPLTAATRAIEDRIRQSVLVEPLPGQIGQPFAATMPDLARASTEALLAGDWLERVLGEHADFTYVNDGIDGGHFRCDCGHAFGYEDGAHAEWEAHLAAAIRAAAGVGL